MEIANRRRQLRARWIDIPVAIIATLAFIGFIWPTACLMPALILAVGAASSLAAVGEWVREWTAIDAYIMSTGRKDLIRKYVDTSDTIMTIERRFKRTKFRAMAKNLDDENLIAAQGNLKMIWWVGTVPGTTAFVLVFGLLLTFAQGW